MRLNPYLTFNGQCEAAFKFYEECLGRKAAMTMTYGDSNLAEQVPRDWHRKIAHATLSVGQNVLQGSDAVPGRYEKTQGFSVMLNIGSAEEAERIFKALAEGGSVQIPLRETFWALRFGEIVDRFGTPWTINCGKPA